MSALARVRDVWWGFKWAVVIAALLLITVAVTEAHDWYPPRCCSGQDCYVIDESEVRLQDDGRWLIVRTKETIRAQGYSPDGLYHRCSYGGDRDAGTICLFVPPQAGS